MAERILKFSAVTLDADYGIIVNTQHWYISPDDYPGAADLLSRWDGMFTTEYRAMLDTTATLQYLHAVEVPYGSSAIENPDTATLLKNVAGTTAYGGTNLDGALGARATLYTGAAGRRNRGGFWFPPAKSAGGVQAPFRFNTLAGYWTACMGFQNKWLAHLTLNGGLPHPWVSCVYSRRKAQSDVVPPYRAISSIVTKNQQYFLHKREARQQ